MSDPPHIRVNLADPAAEYARLKQDVDAAVARVLASGRFILGPEVVAMEGEMASYLGARHAVGVSSGTDAIVAALMALGVGPKDEVITTSFSFFATASAILRVGATPVFVDIEEGGFNLDVSAVERSITPRTRAVLAVHLFGHPADCESLERICADAGVWLVEDAAQAFGASHGTRKAGTIGAVGCFSFFPAKPLGAAGDAGLVCTDDDDLAARLVSVRVQGASGKNLHARPGGNFRIDPLQAAILRVKLPVLDEWTATRRRYAELYRQRLAPLEQGGHVELPRIRQGITCTWAQFTIRCTRRDELCAALRARGIAAEVYYPLPMPMQEAMGKASAKRDSFPLAEKACAEVLSIPVHPMLAPTDVEAVAQAIVDFFASEGKEP